ncbi:beta strand repeat-containing protein [Anatilimnocola sp. NA78]|uniref:beta strand repeat-containing protein n=1 Tax=Anatilimnocola sp. NA78 TaxID=3415683 RepID=UPI003CE48075
MLNRTLRSLWSRFLGQKQQAAASKQRRRAFLEALEDRSLMAALLTWDGGGAADNFGDPLNWDNAGADQLPVSGDTLIFSGLAAGTINNDLAAGTTFSLQFSASGYTITGSSINLNQSAVLPVSTFGIENSSGTNAINVDLTLGDAAGNTINASGGSLSLGGAISNGTGSALTKNGVGNLTLAGTTANTFTGATTVNDGTLILQKTAGVIAVAGALNIGNASGSDVVRLGASDQITDASVITMNSGGGGNSAKFELNGFNETIAGLQSNANQASVIQNTEAGAAAGGNNPAVLTINNTADFIYDGLIRNGGGGQVGLTKNGTGTLTLRDGFAANSTNYTGGTTINAGRLIVDNLTVFVSTPIIINSTVADALTFQGTNSLSVGALISGAGGITKLGTGTLSLTNTANSYSGVTTFGGGILNAASIANLGTNSAIGNRAVDSGPGNVGLLFRGGTLQYTGATNMTTNRAVRISTTGGATIDSSGTGTLSFTATSSPDFYENSGSRTLTLSGTNTGANTFGTQITETGGLTTLRKQGAGTWFITNNNNSYTGETQLAGGILNVSSLSNYGVASAIGSRAAAQEGGGNVGLHFTGGTLQYTGSTAQSTNRQIRFLNGNGATIDASGTGAGTLSFTHAAGNSDLFDTPGTRTLTLTGTNTGINLFAIGLQDQAGSATSLTKSDAGTWAVTGASTHTGATTINAGTLQIGTGGTSGTLGSGAVTNSGVLAFNRSDTITVANNITGVGTLNQISTGTTILTGTNAYGATNITAGTLRVGNAGTVGSLGTGPVANAGTLTFNRTDTISAGNITGVGVINQAGTGTVDLTGVNAAGGTNVTAGRLNVNGTLASNVIVTNPAVLGGSGTITGAVSGTGEVNPGNSPGILTINGNFTPAGPVTFEVNAPYTVAGTDYDQIIVGAPGTTVNLAGASANFVSVGGGTIPALPNVIMLIDVGAGITTTGAFTNFPTNGQTVTLGAGGNARNFRIYYNGGDGNDVVLVDSATPATVYVDDSWNALSGGTIIADADLGTTGNQPAVFGVNAFATINGAVTAAAANGVLIVNGGTYGETVVLVGTQSLEITGPNTAQTVIINSLATIAGQNVVIEGTSNLTIGDATSTIIAGVVSGSGSLTKQGAGTITLSNTNAYSGPTTVNAGVLQATSNSALGTSAVAVNAGTLELVGVTITNTLALNNGATLLANGAVTYSTATNPVIASGATITLATTNLADQLTIGSVITNALGSTVTPTINIAGPGMVAVDTGSNTFRANWSIQAGTLRVSTNNAFGNPTAAVPMTGSTLAFAGGNLLVRADGDLTFNAGSATAIPVTVTANATITKQRLSGVSTTPSDANFGSLSIGSQTLTFANDASLTGGDVDFRFNNLTTLVGNPTFSLTRNLATTSTRTLLRLVGGISDAGVARTATFTNPGTATAETVVVVGATRNLVAGSQIELAGSQLIRYINEGASAGDNASIRFTNSLSTGAVYEARSDSNVTFNNPLILDANGDIRPSRINVGASVTHTFAGITINGDRTLRVVGANLNANTAYGANFSGVLLNGNGTLEVNNNGSGLATMTVTGAVAETGGARNLAKTGSGTLALNATATYTGSTTIASGRVVANTDNVLSNAALVIGSGSTVGTLDLINGSQAVTTFNVSSSTTSVNTINIGAGRTLTSTGNVVIGVNTGASANTRLTVAGAGTWNANNSAATGQFQIGGATGATNSNAAIVDLSGLAIFNANLTGATSVFRVGDFATSGTAVGASTVTLGVNSSITANTLAIGDRGGQGSLMTLRLGSGIQTINANNIDVANRTTGRSSGTLNFNAPTGSLTVRGQAGGATSALLNIGVNSANTGAAINGTVDFTGHSVDANFSVINVGINAGAAAANTPTTYTHALSFDTGVMNITGALNIGSKSSSSVHTTQVNFVNIGGGTVSAASVSLANHTTGAGAVAGTLNVNGGTVTVAGNVILGTASNATGNATATVNLNGGTLQVAGNIAEGTATGTVTSTFNFNGGVLRAGASNATFMQGLDAANVQAGDAIIDSNGFNITIAQPLLDATGDLIKQGTGTLTLTGTNTYTGTTSVNAGVLAVNNGVGTGAILDTAGPVNVALGATLQLLASETVSSYVGAGDGVGSNDSLLALGANTLTTAGDATIANVSTAAGGGIIAGGAIIDGDDDVNITGPDVFLQAATGIGAGNTLETSVSAIQLFNTTSGEIDVLNSVGGLLTVSDLRTLGFGARNDGGATTVVNSSPLTIAANSISVGNVTYTATDDNDAPTLDDDLTINAGVTVQSTTANVFLNAGDDASINGNVSAALQVVIGVDVGDAELPAGTDATTGGTLTIANAAVITTPLAPAGGTYLNGNDDYDTFNLAPQGTTEFFINGNLPTGTSPGDTLNLDISAAVNPLLTLGGIGAGMWTFDAPLRQVAYVSIEDVNANAPYHLALDANNTPFGNTNVDDHLTLSRSGADFVLSRTGDAIAPDDNDVGIVFQGDFATILSFTYLGSNDRDFLTINDVGGLVNFSGLAPGAGDNTNLAGQAEFFFDGGGNDDTLIFALTGPSASQTYAFGTNSGSMPSYTGEVLSTSNAVDLQTYFANVELVQRTGAARLRRAHRAR